jgi:hypothetical protein
MDFGKEMENLPSTEENLSLGARVASEGSWTIFIGAPLGLAGGGGGCAAI